MQRLSSVAIDRLIGMYASQHLGLVTVSALAKVGVDRDALAQRERTGLLQREHVGVYRLLSHHQSLKSRALAACLAIPGSILDSSWSAFVHGFPLRTDRLEAFDVRVIVPSAERHRIAHVELIRTGWIPPHRPWMDGNVVRPGPLLLGLVGQYPASDVARCLDHGIAHSMIRVGPLHSWLVNHPAQRLAGRKTLLELLDARRDGVAYRSKKEAKVANWLRKHGLGGFASNKRISTGGRAWVEADFVWEQPKVVLEVSPFHTHGSERQQARDIERRRMLMLRGYRVIEATDAHLVSSAAFRPIADSLRRLLSADR